MTARKDDVKTINWRNIVEFIGVSALVGSLIFVGVQIQLDRQVAQSQINMAALEASVAIETAMAEHADVWTKAANLEELSKSETQVVERLIKMALNKAFFQTMSASPLRGRTGLERFRESSAVIGAFSALLFENPGARRIWSEMAYRHEAYIKTLGTSDLERQLNNVVRHQLAKLDEGQEAGAFSWK